MMGLIAVFGIILAVYLWNALDVRRGRKNRARLRLESFGENPAEGRGAGRCRDRLAEIGIFYEETKDELPEGAVDEVTWNDLEMDEVFLRINQTESYIGEQTLYRRLHNGGWQEEGKKWQNRADQADVEPEGRERADRKAGGADQADVEPEGRGRADRKADGADQAAGKADGADWERFEEQVRYLTEDEHGREELQEELFRIGKTREDYYLPMFLRSAEMLLVEHLWVYRALQLVLCGSFVTGLATQQPFVIALLIGTALVNLMIYTYSKEKYEVYLYALGSVRRLIRFHRTLMEREEWRRLFVTEEQARVAEELQKLSRYIGSFQRKKSGTATGDMFDLARDYLIGITLWDITSFARIARMIDGRQRELFLLYEACGEADLAVSVASFRKSLPGYCVPETGERPGGACAPETGEGLNGACAPVKSETFVADGLYHPLLTDPVCNDFRPGRPVMITGANASGKSTFLKAVAVNAILAQTIHTAAARRLVMPRMQVITSMAVRDDLVAGESYYIREVSYLKRIMDAVQGRVPALCVIDEILRGTNTGERLAASEAVCRYLAECGGLALVATHDMELAEKLKGLYECYYFQSDIQESEITFDYRIHAGLAGGQNAIRLLAYLDFPKEVVQAAEQLYRARG